jgi:hypothetical protein
MPARSWTRQRLPRRVASRSGSPPSRRSTPRARRPWSSASSRWPAWPSRSIRKSQVSARASSSWIARAASAASLARRLACWLLDSSLLSVSRARGARGAQPRAVACSSTSEAICLASCCWTSARARVSAWVSRASSSWTRARWAGSAGKGGRRERAPCCRQAPGSGRLSTSGIAFPRSALSPWCSRLRRESSSLRRRSRQRVRWSNWVTEISLRTWSAMHASRHRPRPQHPQDHVAPQQAPRSQRRRVLLQPRLRHQLPARRAAVDVLQRPGVLLRRELPLQQGRHLFVRQARHVPGRVLWPLDDSSILARGAGRPGTASLAGSRDTL